MKQLLLVAAFVIIVNLLALLPYVVGAWHSTPERPFTGHVDPGPEDYSHHMLWAKQAYQGHILFEYKQNGNETHTRLIFNLLFLLIGWTGRLLEIPLILAFHLVRLVIGVLLCITIYRFLCHFIQERGWRWIAFCFISFTSGLGWIEMSGLAPLCPADLHFVEISTFWHLRWEVVTTPTVLLLLVIFLFGLRHFKIGSFKSALVAALFALVLGFVHPHNLLTVYCVFFVHTLITLLTSRQPRPGQPILRRPWVLLAITVLLSAPSFAYYRSILNQEPLLWEYVGLQNDIDPFKLLLGYGIPALLGILGIVFVLSERAREFYFLVTWLVCGVALFYVPVPPAGQVFALDGLHIPICILATKGLQSTFRGLKASFAKGRTAELAHQILGGAALVSLIFVSSLTNILALTNEVVMATGRGDPPFMSHALSDALTGYARSIGVADQQSNGSPYFLPRELRDALDWLGAHTHPSEVVLAPPYVSVFVPYLSGNRVYFGHMNQTADAAAKLERIFLFYNKPATIEVRRRFLIENDFAYVLFWSTSRSGDLESERFVRSLEALLPVELAYRNRQTLIFRVEQGLEQEPGGD